MDIQRIYAPEEIVQAINEAIEIRKDPKRTDPENDKVLQFYQNLKTQFPAGGKKFGYFDVEQNLRKQGTHELMYNGVSPEMTDEAVNKVLEIVREIHHRRNVTINLSEDARNALIAIRTKIRVMRPNPSGTHTDTSAAGRKFFTDKIDRLLGDENKVSPSVTLPFDEAQDLVCTLKSAQNASVNKNSFVKYAVGQFKGIFHHVKTGEEDFTVTRQLKQLNVELNALIKEHGFDYEAFEEIQKPIRREIQSTNVGTDKKLGLEKRAKLATYHSTKEAVAEVNTSIGGYKKSQQYKIADDDTTLDYYRSLKKKLEESTPELTLDDMKDLFYRTHKSFTFKTQTEAGNVGKEIAKWVKALEASPGVPLENVTRESRAGGKDPLTPEQISGAVDEAVTRYLTGKTIDEKDLILSFYALVKATFPSEKGDVAYKRVEEKIRTISYTVWGGGHNGVDNDELQGHTDRLLAAIRKIQEQGHEGGISASL